MLFQDNELHRTADDDNQEEGSHSIDSTSYTFINSVKSHSYTIVSPGPTDSTSYTVVATCESLEETKTDQNDENIIVASHDATTNTHGNFVDEQVIANYYVDSIVYGAVAKVLANDFVGKPVALVQDVATSPDTDYVHNCVTDVQNASTSTDGDIVQCVVSQQTNTMQDAMQDVCGIKELSIESLIELARQNGFVLVSVDDAASVQDDVVHERHVISLPTEEHAHSTRDLGQRAAGASSVNASDDNGNSHEGVVVADQNDDVERLDNDSKCTETDARGPEELTTAETCNLCEPSDIQQTLVDQQGAVVSCNESLVGDVLDPATGATGAIAMERPVNAEPSSWNTAGDNYTCKPPRVIERVATFLQYTNNDTSTAQYGPDPAEHITVAENIPYNETAKPQRDTSNVNYAEQPVCNPDKHNDVIIADYKLDFEREHSDGENKEDIDFRLYHVSAAEKSASSTSTVEALELFTISETYTSIAIKCKTISEKDEDVDHERPKCKSADEADLVNVTNEFDVGPLKPDTVNTADLDRAAPCGDVEITDPFILGKGRFWGNDGAFVNDSYMYIYELETFDPEVKRGRFMEPLDQNDCLATANHEYICTSSTSCLDYERDKDINTNNIMGGVSGTNVGMLESVNMHKDANEIHPRCVRSVNVPKKYIPKKKKTSKSKTNFIKANRERFKLIESSVNYVNQKQTPVAVTIAEQVVDENRHDHTGVAEPPLRKALNLHGSRSEAAALCPAIPDVDPLITSETFVFPEECVDNRGSTDLSETASELKAGDAVSDEIVNPIVEEQSTKSASFCYSGKVNSSSSQRTIVNLKRKFGMPRLQKRPKPSKELPVRSTNYGSAISSLNSQSRCHTRSPISHSAALPKSVSRVHGQPSFSPKLSPKSPTECHKSGLKRPAKWTPCKSQHNSGEISAVASLSKPRQVTSSRSYGDATVSVAVKPAAPDSRLRLVSGIQPPRVIRTDKTMQICAASVTHSRKSADISVRKPDQTLTLAKADSKSKIPVKTPVSRNNSGKTESFDDHHYLRSSTTSVCAIPRSCSRPRHV